MACIFASDPLYKASAENLFENLKKEVPDYLSLCQLLYYYENFSLENDHYDYSAIFNNKYIIKCKQKVFIE